jgi:hypothetical protein
MGNGGDEGDEGVGEEELLINAQCPMTNDK